MLVGNSAAVLISHDLAHLAAGGAGHSVQNGLRHAVADSRVQALAVDSDAFDHFRQLFKAVRLLPDQRRLDVLLNNRNEVLGQKQRVAAARAAVLHGRAVAVSDLAVFQHQHDRNGLAGLAHGGKAGRHRLADISRAVVPWRPP